MVGQGLMHSVEYHPHVMSEADWWLCGDCQSLNNLSARTCYSCGRRKPAHAVRATEVLGLIPVESWDGKVRYLQRDVPPEPRPWVRPIRDPVRRPTLAVAPRPPYGARITYHPTVVPPSPGQARARVGTHPGRPSTAMPTGDPSMAPRMERPDEPPAVAVGPGLPVPPEDPAIVDRGPHWPHWRDLLDVPTPRADRLRAAYGPGGYSTQMRDEVPTRSAGLRAALASARRDRRPDVGPSLDAEKGITTEASGRTSGAEGMREG